MATVEQTTSLGERVSRIEGGYEHLATKTDLARVETRLAQAKAELKAEIAELRVDIRGIKWWIISAAAAVAALSGLAQLLPLGG